MAYYNDEYLNSLRRGGKELMALAQELSQDSAGTGTAISFIDALHFVSALHIARQIDLVGDVIEYKTVG